MTTRDVIRTLEQYEEDMGESELLKDVIILEPRYKKIRFYVPDPDIEGGRLVTETWVPRSTEKETERAPEPKLEPKKNSMEPKHEYFTHDKTAHFAMTELKPCPYCGNTDLYIDDVEVVIGEKYGHCVACKDCGMNGPIASENEAQAIAAWNYLCSKLCTRCVRAVAARAHRLEQEVKRLKEELQNASL